MSRSFADTLRSPAAVEEVGYEPARIFGIVEPREVPPVGQSVEFAFRHEGGNLTSGLDAAERVMRASQLENGLGDGEQLFGNEPVARFRTGKPVYRRHQAEG